MATINRTVGVSYEGIEANELFFEPFWMDMLALGDFRVMPNVVNKKKMQFVQKLEKIVQKGGGCGFHPSGKFGMYDRTIEVDEVKVNIEQCFDEFKDTVLQEKLKKGNMKMNLSDTEIMRLMILNVQDGMMLDYMRLFWFGDKSSNDAAYNITDGMWSVHIPALVADNVTPYTNANSGAPLAPGASIDLLSDVYKAQSNSLAGIPAQDKRFFVSRSVWEGYEDDLEALGGGDAGRTQTIEGVTTLTYRGIRLVLNANWDEYTANDLGQPDEHQVMLTTPDNLVFATDIFSDLNKIQAFFDELDEKTKIKVNAKFGSNFVHPALFSVAY
jgi:hypothetical protein